MLNNLTDPYAVRAAMEEYDFLGRDAFLEKHGFGEAYRYFLSTPKQLYDSKAIAGVAIGIENPHLAPVPNTSFSGGEATVVRKLEALGFTVIVANAPPSASYWALCANPQIYRIDEAIKDLQTDWWNTGRRKLKRGDKVAIWRTAAGGTGRGVVAFGEVLTDPEQRVDADNPYWLDSDRAAESAPRVQVRYRLADELPLLASGPAQAVLASLSVFRARGGTAFRITPKQWVSLDEAAGGPRAHLGEEEDLEVLVSPSSKTSGQGFMASAKKRRAVELRAMKLAKDYYEKHWTTVTDVSGTASYDLRCEGAAGPLLVEVKGTTGLGTNVLLTRNEVQLSRDRSPNTALFVVSNIKVGGFGHSPTASGGSWSEIRPWNVDSFELTATAYRVDLGTTK